MISADIRFVKTKTYIVHISDICYSGGTIVRYDAGELTVVLAMPHLVEAVPRRRTHDVDDPGPLARLLLRLRGERGWRQKDVVDRAGFEQGYYSSLETGAIQKPSKEKLEALDMAFGLELGTISGRLRSRTESPAFELLPPGPDGELVALVRRIPDRDKPQAIRILRTFVPDDEMAD